MVLDSPGFMVVPLDRTVWLIPQDESTTTRTVSSTDVGSVAWVEGRERRVGATAVSVSRVVGRRYTVCVLCLSIMYKL